VFRVTNEQATDTIS